MLYTLYSAVCQLRHNKTKKKEKYGLNLKNDELWDATVNWGRCDA